MKSLPGDYIDRGFILGKIICNIMDTKHIVIYSTRENLMVRKEIGKREGKEILGYQGKCILHCHLRKIILTVINERFVRKNEMTND